MNLWQQRFDVLTKLAFGHGARLDGSIGSPSRPGVLEIKVDGRTLGTGGTFQAALQDVTRSCSRDQKAVA